MYCTTVVTNCKEVEIKRDWKQKGTLTTFRYTDWTSMKMEEILSGLQGTKYVKSKGPAFSIEKSC